MLEFPNAVHDDQVDSTSQFLNWVKQSAAAQVRIRQL
jgi:phage terminase large subunit-like protein